MRVIKAEEERFAAMVGVGLERLEGVIAGLQKSGGNTIPGVEIFKLYDTFGFPLDFTKEIADEKSMNLDMAGFEAELEKQRERARQSWKGDEGRVNPVFQKFAEGGTQFLGYQAVKSAGQDHRNHEEAELPRTPSMKCNRGRRDSARSDTLLCRIGRTGR